MKFSMMTYTLMRQKIYTPADCIRIAVELGMDGIDWVTTYGEDPRELKKQCDDANLPIVAHTFFLRKADLDDVKSAAARNLDNAVALGAPLVMIPPMPLDSEQDADGNRRIWAEILKKVAPLAGERKLALSVENFPGKASPVVTSADFRALKAEVPELKLTFDNGNAFPGEDQIASLRRCFDDVVHVHFKDWERRDEFVEGWREMSDGKFYRAALIGEGVVDSRATLRELEALGYTGYINIEYESCACRGDLAIKRVLEYLRG
jgi:sugar phosphate isomerase/epimerase